MPSIIIYGRSTTVTAGTTVLAAARGLGIEVPTLCQRDGCVPFTSCMVCVVKDAAGGRMIPSCTALADDGMRIETDTAEVRDARRVALELLLSDHVGDCAAPCQRACPAHLHIPLMLRQIAAGRLPEALATVTQAIPFPAVLGRICPAPCEKACRRAAHDDAVSICLLKRFVGDTALAIGTPHLPPRSPATGKRIALVGAGPAGLSAAYYLLQHGHACTIIDEHDEPGGALRHAIPAERLPRAVLDGEIEPLRRMGAEFRLRTRLGRDVALADLQRDFSAVVLAMGKLDLQFAAGLAVELTASGVRIHPHTAETSVRGIFAGGDVVHPHGMAIRAVAAGRTIACAVHQFVSGQPVSGLHHRFDSLIGRLHEGECDQLMPEANPAPGLHPPSDSPRGLPDAAARTQAARCLHCDCRKANTCRLREYADAYDAKQRRYTSAERRPIVFDRRHARIVFEPGKCIRCGLCVQITRNAAERLGLTFIGRGFDVHIGVPFDESLADALSHTAAECVAACPTAALAFRVKDEGA